MGESAELVNKVYIVTSHDKLDDEAYRSGALKIVSVHLSYDKANAALEKYRENRNDVTAKIIVWAVF